MRKIVCDNKSCNFEEDLNEVEKRFEANFMQQGAEGAAEGNWFQFGDLHLCPKCSKSYKALMKPVNKEWEESRDKILENLVGSDIKPVPLTPENSNVVNIFGKLGDESGDDET